MNQQELSLGADKLERIDEEPRAGASTDTAAPAAWPTPAPLPKRSDQVPALEPNMLPEPLRPWLVDVAERMQCPLDYPAVAAIVALSSVVGRKLAIRPKQKDDWAKVPNLWGAFVGPPGVLKTPSAEEALKPLLLLQREADEKHRNAERAAGFDDVVLSARRKAITDRIREAAGDDATLASLRKEMAALHAERPASRCYVVHDATVERLGQLLEVNPRGLLMYRDELMGWLRTMDRKGHENDRPFYLQAWDGNGSYSFDRVTRSRVTIHGICVAVLGSIQPGPLSHYVREAASHGSGDDGLLQRFQLLVYPDVSPDFRIVDEAPDFTGRDRAYQVYRSIDLCEPRQVGAETGQGDALPFLRFDDAARELYFDFWRRLERRIRPPSTLHPALIALLSKYRGLMPSLALLFHLVDCVDQGIVGPVTLASAERALAWCRFLEAHAHRIYGQSINAEDIATRELAQRILSGALPSPFKLRDVYRAGWAGLRAPAAVETAVSNLAGLDWLRVRSVATGGRPTVECDINPRLDRNTMNNSRQNRRKQTRALTQPTEKCSESRSEDD